MRISWPLVGGNVPRSRDSLYYPLPSHLASGLSGTEKTKASAVRFENRDIVRSLGEIIAKEEDAKHRLVFARTEKPCRVLKELLIGPGDNAGLVCDEHQGHPGG